MKSKLLVVADLGRFKAFRLEESPHFSHPRLRLVEDWETSITNHLSEEVTDQAGRYRNAGALGTGDSPTSDGEEHNLDLERRRRALKTLAHRLHDLIDREGNNGCYLAADSRINNSLLEELDSRTRSRIEKILPLNLSKASSAELIRQFTE